MAVTLRQSEPVTKPARIRLASLDGIPRLVRRARNGDTAAFEDLYRMYHPRIFRLAQFHVGRTGAEDATAETFLRAWAALPRYRDTGVPFVAWLYGIARHVVADQLEAESRVESTSEVPERPIYSDQDDRLSLVMAIAELPEGQRRVVELKFMVGLSNAEVAAAVGKTIGAVNTQQWRALRKLRRILDGS